MERKYSFWQWGLMLCFLSMAALVMCRLPEISTKTAVSYRRFLRSTNSSGGVVFPPVTLRRLSHGYVVMDNGLLQVTLSTPSGHVAGVKYNGIQNLLEVQNSADNRGYWDIVWNRPQESNSIDKLRGTSFRVVVQTVDQLEVSFTRTWTSSPRNTNLPINIDKRYILLRGSSGFYTYSILERLEGWPAIEMDQIRAVYKPQNEKFRYMAVADDMQRIMPTPEDRKTGDQLAYPEAVLLTNPEVEDVRGEVDDKYMYSLEDKDNKVHGWICADPPTGIWMITPSDEFRVAGPVKQDLTSHVGPTTLSMFVSTHYAGKDVGMQFGEGEPWKKVFGPVFVYLNSLPEKADPLDLWDDAKQQMRKQVDSWPYSFPESAEFPTSEQRGTVSGQLLVRDRYINESLISADQAYVGLALPGDLGSWQRESKGYQFWTRADKDGNFSIKNVRPGTYNLYAWVPGFIGDYKYETNVTVEPGSAIGLDNLVFEPPRQGPTFWEIGIPDRTAAEFFVPSPYPTLMNRLYYEPKNNFRQYGLWERYADLYPMADLVHNVGDNYTTDWFFAHVTRKNGNGSYDATTWQIVFVLDLLDRSGTYTLQLALASATESEVQVRWNNPAGEPHFSTGLIGKDNAIARHGIHGLYWLYTVNVSGQMLVSGKNTIYLTQSRHQTPFQGVMYDYIRFEGPLT